MRVTPKRDNAMTNPSVCLSITLWYCIETYAHIVKLSPPSGSGTTVVAWSATAVLKKNPRRRLEKFAIFDRQKSPFISETVRYKIGP